MTTTSPTTQVSLSTDQFREAIDRYIDSTKPDPLSTKQLQAWTLEWTNHPPPPPSTTTTTVEDQADTVTPDHDPQDQDHYVIHGTLSISGEYILLYLHVTCRWTTLRPKNSPSLSVLSSSSSMSNPQKQQYGTLSFSCHSSARFHPDPSSSSSSPDPAPQRLPMKKASSTSSKKDEVTTTTIHSKMMDRLKQDAYISKLLLPSSMSSSISSSLLVAHAEIVQMSMMELEERVTISEEVCEGIHRAVWSKADDDSSTLDVVDLLVNLPCLPTTPGSTSSNSSSSTTNRTPTTTTLANRAKLRLLEDAMCDACEKEGEEELLEELQISAPPKKQKR